MRPCKIFLSVAGPDRPKVEEVALALRSEGHQVFLDVNELPSGASYHQRIRNAIMNADLIVFFISPSSIEAERYTLTELKFVESRFQVPHNRVLPVLLAPVDMNRVPHYLRAVTIYKPRGNLGAEVAFEISRMAGTLGQVRRGSAPTPSVPAPALQFRLVEGAIAATLFGALALFVGFILPKLLKVMGSMSALEEALIYGAALTLLMWLVAILFDIRNPLAYLALAAGSLGAYVFEIGVLGSIGPSIIYVGKSLVFVCCVAVVLPAFRSPLSWVLLLSVGVLAGQLPPTYKGDAITFVWDALTVGMAAFLLALNDRTEKTSPFFRDVTSTIYRRMPKGGR